MSSEREADGAKTMLIEYLARFGGAYGDPDTAAQEADGLLATLEQGGWLVHAELERKQQELGEAYAQANKHLCDRLEADETIKRIEATNRWQAESIRSVTAERDALQRQIEALTSDKAVEAAYQAWGACENDMPEAMRVAITAAVEASRPS